MIVNELQNYELAKIFETILRLKSPDETLACFEEILQIPIKHKYDVTCQNRTLVKYKDYRLTISDLRWSEEGSVSMVAQFMRKNQWWHGWLRDQNAILVRDLQMICKTEVDGLSFSKYTKTISQSNIVVTNPPKTLTYFHDKRAWNSEWKIGYEISPLLIMPDSHDGNCFVEFSFNADAYYRQGAKTCLRENWKESASNIIDGIRRDAARHLV